MGIVLTDNSFELIFQHLNLSDILNLCQVSKSLHEIISNSSKCMSKIALNLTSDDSNQVVEFLRCFRNNKRKYQNVTVDCHSNHYLTEKYMLILKTIERSIVTLEVKNASFRWDEINTRNFHDQWLILTDLKDLKVVNINDYTAEIFFISCTYLENLHVEQVRLSKYFNYCLRVNEKLKHLVILKPIGVSYDYEFYGFIAYNFKLDHFEFNCEANRERNKHDFLKRVIYPVLTTQVNHLRTCRVNGIYFDAVNAILDVINRERFECWKLAYAHVTTEHVRFSINNLELFCVDQPDYHAEFCDKLGIFMDQQKNFLTEVTVSSPAVDVEILKIILQNSLENIKWLNIGGNFESDANLHNDKITKIVTSSTCLKEMKNILRCAPCLKVLQVFLLSKELLNLVRKELKELEVVRFHYRDIDCAMSDIKLVKYSNYDPLLRICDDLHDLVFQHIDDDCFVEELTRPWTRFFFK